MSIKDIEKLSSKIEINSQLIDSLANKLNSLESKKELYHNFSRFFRIYGDNKSALKYGNIELTYFDKLNLKDKKYHIALHLVGCYYHDNNQFLKAIEILKKSARLDIYPKKAAQSLCMLGSCYRAKGDIKKSINYYKKGISSLKKLNNKKSIVAHSINLALTANFSNNISDIQDAINYLFKVDSIIKNKSYPNFFLDVFNINNSLGNLYSKKETFDIKKSKYHYLKCLRLSKQENKYFFLSLASMNYGELLLKIKSDSSIYYLNKSLIKNTNKKHQNYNLLKAESHRNIANYYFWKKNLKKALKSINISLKTSFNLEIEDMSPTKFQLHKTSERLNISKALNTKIQILNQLYLKTDDSKYLNQIIETVNISDQLVEIILEDSTESSTQFSWRNNISKIYKYGIYAARLLGSENLQFQYLEKNKAFLLTQSINDNNYSLNLPNHIVDEELGYKKQILQLEDQTLTSDSKKLKDSLFDIKFAYQSFKDSIQKIYPEHFESKKKVELTSLQDVKQQIDNNTIVISYALHDETTTFNASTGLLISKNKSIPFSISNIEKLKTDLNIYRQLLARPLSNKNKIKQYNTAANSLYNSLFPTDEIKDLIQNKKVVIIPDDNLQNIPFEAFITDTTSNKYLIENTDISYAYSMSFLNVNNKISRTPEKDFAGFAPVEFENEKLATLQHSAEEIYSINNNLNGITLTGENVTKDSFLTNASDAKIIHLATHADISRKPVIHFSKDSLNLHELYTYKNNADLVVLSACETNVGELKKGEGILNLARGFFYSGSKSVVSSLWKVNDVATTELMTDFYTNLKDHQSKSEALNNAKRKYLKNHSLSEKSPYYWASFILIGDTNPTFESNSLIYWILGGIFIVFLFFFSYNKLINKRK
ncbi:CHAT domain-containing protein [Tenacibaculum jejuense]|uniref:CHAT domain-containing protein n=1 Tax=Tenacibaculum jejuense TaxID=584609 RepID=UPI00138FB415|nr:CHAT domain-containing tetratricopeptide repeat protein [Tenacibaculum jejuense]